MSGVVKLQPKLGGGGALAEADTLAAALVRVGRPANGVGVAASALQFKRGPILADGSFGGKGPIIEQAVANTRSVVRVGEI